MTAEISADAPAVRTTAWFALPAWEIPTFWEERLGGDGSPYLGREFSVVWATKEEGREQGCSRYYWALMWKGLGLARAVLIMIKIAR